jgi:hypothetical protein
LTPEVLTTSFISNINYIKKYKSKNVFGVTGSLGSRAEQQFLSNIYFVTYAKLPTYKPRVFRELNGIVAKDANWHLTLILAIIEKIEGEESCFGSFGNGKGLALCQARLGDTETID